MVGEKWKREEEEEYPPIPCTDEEMNAVIDKWVGDGVFRPFKPIREEIEDYVDNVVVKSKTRGDHHAILSKVFERCLLYKLRMNPLKCAFRVTARKFMGFLVHQRGIDVDPSKV